MSYEIIMKKIGTNFVWYGGMKINKWNTEKRIEIMTKKKNRRKTVKNCEESKRDKEEKEVD